MRGKEFIEYDNPFDVGMTGLLGLIAGYYAMMSCETLLMLAPLSLSTFPLGTGHDRLSRHSR